MHMPAINLTFQAYMPIVREKHKLKWIKLHFMFLSDEGSTVQMLDFAFYIGSTPTSYILIWELLIIFYFNFTPSPLPCTSMCCVQLVRFIYN